MTSAPFWAYSSAGAFSTGAFYIFLAGAPLAASVDFGVETAALGAYIGSITGGFLAGGFVAARLAPRFALSTTMIAGRLAALAGIGGAALAVETGPTAWFGCLMLVGFGNGVTMPGAASGALSAAPEASGAAAGLNGALIVACGAALTAATGALLPETGAAPVLLALMAGATLAALGGALWARRLERG